MKLCFSFINVICTLEASNAQRAPYYSAFKTLCNTLFKSINEATQRSPVWSGVSGVQCDRVCAPCVPCSHAWWKLLVLTNGREHFSTGIVEIYVVSWRSHWSEAAIIHQRLFCKVARLLLLSVYQRRPLEMIQHGLRAVFKILHHVCNLISILSFSGREPRIGYWQLRGQVRALISVAVTPSVWSFSPDCESSRWLSQSFLIKKAVDLFLIKGAIAEPRPERLETSVYHLQSRTLRDI